MSCLNFINAAQRSSIGAVGVRLCSSARPQMPLELVNLNLLRFTEVPCQPLTAARLCFMLKYGCRAPIAANAHVGCSFTTYFFHSVILESPTVESLRSVMSSVIV